MPDSVRQPPRFVPTLTEVVQAPTLEPALATVPVDAASKTRLPGQGVLSALAAALTPRVTTPAPAARSPSAGAAPAAPTAARASASASASADSLALQNAVLRRVMPRIDNLLAQRLAPAVTELLEQQWRALGNSLRLEIDFVVRAAVAEALADALQTPPASAHAARPPAAPASDPNPQNSADHSRVP